MHAKRIRQWNAAAWASILVGAWGGTTAASPSALPTDDAAVTLPEGTGGGGAVPLVPCEERPADPSVDAYAADQDPSLVPSADRDPTAGADGQEPFCPEKSAPLLSAAEQHSTGI